MKNTTLSLLLVLFVSACSHKTESNPTSTTAGLPEFTIAVGDVVSTSVETVTGHMPSSPTQAESMVHIELSGAKGADFRKFTKDHVGQQVQILVGTKVVQEPMIAAEIVSPKIDLLYSTPAEAQSVADLLSKK
jgi:preprotein translocase subunit SecD